MPAKKNPKAEALMRLTHANMHFLKGASRAAVAGYDNFLNRLRHENIGKRKPEENGFVLGAFDAWITLLFEGALRAEEAFDKWLERGSVPSRSVRRRRKSPRAKVPNGRAKPSGRN
jgi:hypothetical protein